jgi:hypothetical protein
MALEKSKLYLKKRGFWVPRGAKINVQQQQQQK